MGTPRKDTTIPTGIITGARRSRPTVSAVSISTDPTAAEQGRRSRWRPPTSSRAKWGPARPTKPVAPPT